MANYGQTVRLPDGRIVRCTSPAEALLIWRELSGNGFYARAADHLNPDDVVLDIGANIGLASLAFWDKQPRIRLLAAEPIPEVFECLEANLSRYLPGSVTIPSAVAEFAGRRQITHYPAAPGNSGFYADKVKDDALTKNFLLHSGHDEFSAEMLLEGLHEGVSLDVSVTTVSELISNHRLEKVSLLKIDVERSELDVIRGISADHWPLIERVVAEVHDENDRLSEIVEFLERRGLSVQTRQDPLLIGSEVHELHAFR